MRFTRGAPFAHRYTYAPPRCRTNCSTAGLLFISRCSSGTILLTPYSKVWDLRVSRAGQCFFIGLSCAIPTIVLYSFSLSLLSVYRLVLWGCGLRTDKVYKLYITLSQPCTANLFLIIIRIIIEFHTPFLPGPVFFRTALT